MGAALQRITGGRGAGGRRGVGTPPYGREARGRGAGGASGTPPPTRGVEVRCGGITDCHTSVRTGSQ